MGSSVFLEKKKIKGSCPQFDIILIVKEQYICPPTNTYICPQYIILIKGSLFHQLVVIHKIQNPYFDFNGGILSSEISYVILVDI